MENKEELFDDIFSIVVGVHSNDPVASKIIAQRKLRDYISSQIEAPAMQKNAEVIDEMIRENKKYYDEKGVCWLCYENEYCYHEYKIKALEELKEKLSKFAV